MLDSGRMLRLAIILLLVKAPLYRAQSQATVASPLKFEVASVKPNKSGDRDASMNPSPGGFYATNTTLKFLITWAYDVGDHQISAGPNWINTERYDIVAKGQIDRPNSAQYRQMLQTLLADRFQLRLRRETKELPVYALVVGKNGSKLREADGVGMTTGRGRITARRISMERFAAHLGNRLGRTVLDRTGLQGNFAFELEWTPDPGQPLGPNPTPLESSGPSIFTALQDQLGLKLEPQKGSVEMLVIDHVEKPSEN
jgi:uncharacterized protein (TIGR03435 family)